MLKKCCKECRYVQFKDTMKKWPVQKPTHRTTHKHVEHHDATDIMKKTFFCVFTSNKGKWPIYPKYADTLNKFLLKLKENV